MYHFTNTTNFQHLCSSDKEFRGEVFILTRCVCECAYWEIFLLSLHPSVYIDVFLALSDSAHSPFICKTYGCHPPLPLHLLCVCVFDSFHT